MTKCVIQFVASGSWATLPYAVRLPAHAGIDGPDPVAVLTKGVEARLVPDSRYILRDVQPVATVIEADFCHNCCYLCVLDLLGLKSAVVMPITSERLQSSLISYTYPRPRWECRFVRLTHEN
jgi:hypothetical protein